MLILAAAELQIRQNEGRVFLNKKRVIRAKIIFLRRFF